MSSAWDRFMVERAAHLKNMEKDEHWPDERGVALCRMEPSPLFPRLTWFANQAANVTCPQCRRIRTGEL